ncbi:hypothetical protein [Brachyspira sp.]|uniref:hypothetical protein n=1 Tax=Brachyspira sp. TaxID=1977261 RepID=UPI003D7D6E3D
MNKLIKIFLITLFALAISCSNEGTTGGDTGGDGGVYDNPDLEYGQFLPPKTSYTGYNFAKKEQTTTIQVVKNSDGTCNLKGKIVLVTPENFDASTGKYKEIDVDIKVNDWSRTKGSTDSGSARIDKTTLPAGITYFGASYYFKAAHKDISGNQQPDTYHLDFAVNGDSYAFQGKAY